MLAALAGGGLGAAGLGPLAGGALADGQTQTGPTTGPEAPPPAPAETTTETTATEPPSSSSTSTSPAPAPVPSATSPAPAPSTTSTPAETPAPASRSAKPKSTPHSAPAPAVVLQRKQESTASKKTGKNSKTTATKPAAGAQQGAANNDVAAAPQVIAAQAGALAAELAGAAASNQALSFYRIPLFLLPIYQAASVQYGVPWQILAAINEVETNYGTDLSVSSAGAVGWMQFMPATWLQYGVDALNSGYADPYNPVDAIFAAARYLRAAGAASDLNAAILAYNHSGEYLNSVLLRAKLISSYPKTVIATLTGLTDGRLPVTGKPLAWGSLTSVPASSSATAHASAVPTGVKLSAPTTGSAAPVPAGAATGASSLKAKTPPPVQLVDLVSATDASVVATQDGRIIRLGHSRTLGKFVVLRDVYGDVFTYASLGSVATHYRKPKLARAATAASASPLTAARSTESKPALPATAGHQPPLTLRVKTPLAAHSGQPGAPGSAALEEGLAATGGKVRLFAHPGNPDALASAASARKRVAHAGHLLPLRVGSIVTKGTVLGRVRTSPGARAGHLRFAIRPGGDRETIDPRPILENWAQLQAALHPQGASGQTDLLGATAAGVFLMSKGELQRAVLGDPGVSIYACGRQDIASGAIDRRVLAVLEFLSRSGLRPTVSALECGHSEMTVSGFVSEHFTGDAVDISAINGIPIAGHQGAGTITDVTIRALLTLQGEFVPHQIISLMHYPGAANTLAMPEHWNHIHIGFRPDGGDLAQSPAAAAAAHSAGTGQPAAAPLVATGPLNTTQWSSLITRIGALPAPKVRAKPSSSAIKDPKPPKSR